MCKIVNKKQSVDLTVYGQMDRRMREAAQAAGPRVPPAKEAACGGHISLRKTGGTVDSEGRCVFRMQTEAKFVSSHLNLGP